MLFRFFLFFLLLFCEIVWGIPGFYEPWGKDSLLYLSKKKDEKKEIQSNLMIRSAEKVIWFHQNIISPVDGPRSHFRPSSSSYMLEAIRKHGFLKGYLMGCDRLLRENDEEWVYRTIEFNGNKLKWDPPP